jgi:hypothetical protein
MNKSGRMRWAEHVARMEAIRKPEGKRPFRRHSCKWEDDIRMDFTEIGWENVDFNPCGSDSYEHGL